MYISARGSLAPVCTMIVNVQQQPHSSATAANYDGHGTRFLVALHLKSNDRHDLKDS